MLQVENEILYEFNIKKLSEYLGSTSKKTHIRYLEVIAKYHFSLREVVIGTDVITDHALCDITHSADVFEYDDYYLYSIRTSRTYTLWQLVKSIFNIPSCGLRPLTGKIQDDVIMTSVQNVLGDTDYDIDEGTFFKRVKEKERESK